MILASLDRALQAELKKIYERFERTHTEKPFTLVV